MPGERVVSSSEEALAFQEEGTPISSLSLAVILGRFQGQRKGFLGLAEGVDGDVCIELGGLNLAMAEEILDASEVLVEAQEVRRERMIGTGRLHGRLSIPMFSMISLLLWYCSKKTYG